MAEIEAQIAPVSLEAPRRAAKDKTKACVRGKETSEVVTFRGSPPPDSHIKWVGQQDAAEIPKGGRLLDSSPGFPDELLVIEDDQKRRESSFRRNRESGSSNKGISPCFTSDLKGSLER